MKQNQQPLENGSSSDEEREQFLKALSSSIEIFVNRMKSNSQRGRSIANDSSVQTLFMTLTAMHPTLMKYMQQQEESRGLSAADDVFITLLFLSGVVDVCLRVVWRFSCTTFFLLQLGSESL